PSESPSISTTVSSAGATSKVLYSSTASPSTSKPGPRFAHVAGTLTRIGDRGSGIGDRGFVGLVAGAGSVPGSARSALESWLIPPTPDPRPPAPGPVRIHRGCSAPPGPRAHWTARTTGS